MITQVVLNWLSDTISKLIGQFPALPIEWNQALSMVSQGGAWLGSHLSNFGVIVPWSTFTVIIQVWLGLLAFWLVCQGVRVVLWALGR